MPNYKFDGTDLFTLGCDRIDFINEDDSWCVLLGLFKGLSQITFRLSGHLAHNFGTVDQEEEGTSLVCDSTSHERFTRSRRAKEQDTTRWFDTNGFEELRMTKWKLDKFSDLGHLFSAATNVIVANISEIVFFIFTLDWVTLCNEFRMYMV